MNTKTDTGNRSLDFSETAARRAAFFDLIQHPLTLWPPALGTAAGVGLAMFGIASAPVSLTIAGMAERMPNELTVKALTLGATQFQVLYKIIAPQMLPRLIDLIRVSLGSAWIFVIAAEAVAATEGLGYRIYLQQRYMNMALIIPYVIYISLLAYASDLALLGVLKLPWFRWYSNCED